MKPLINIWSTYEEFPVELSNDTQIQQNKEDWWITEEAGENITNSL